MKAIHIRKVTILFVFVNLCFGAQDQATSKGDDPSALLDLNEPWNGLTLEARRLLAKRLNTADNAKFFIELWQREGMEPPEIAVRLLRENSFDQDELEFALGLIVSKAASYANSLGKAGRLSEAQQVAQMALLIKPNHYPSYLTLMIIGVETDNCIMAREWAEKVLAISEVDLSESSDYFDSATGENIDEMKEFARRVLEVFAC